MPHKTTLTNHHADSSICPKEHKYTVTGKPTHPDCPGRAYTRAACTCGWDFQCPGKGYADEERKRHRTTNPKPTPGGPKVLRDLLRLDAE
ncbi:hypothetical protein ACIGXM_25200 [Kitasatospora sp. NPDC052896]|uniref:hypothetical protein n=1 Tax=Kitasatospora sp. NPDC052896 TaxID=3364061 RepID=UPI0037CA876C